MKKICVPLSVIEQCLRTEFARSSAIRVGRNLMQALSDWALANWHLHIECGFRRNRQNIMTSNYRRHGIESFEENTETQEVLLEHVLVLAYNFDTLPRSSGLRKLNPNHVHTTYKWLKHSYIAANNLSLLGASRMFHGLLPDRTRCKTV